jgi:hypothetical protein
MNADKTNPSSLFSIRVHRRLSAANYFGLFPQALKRSVTKFWVRPRKLLKSLWRALLRAAFTLM